MCISMRKPLFCLLNPFKKYINKDFISDTSDYQQHENKMIEGGPFTS